MKNRCRPDQKKQFISIHPHPGKDRRINHRKRRLRPVKAELKLFLADTNSVK